MRFMYTEAQLNFLRKHYPAKTIAELTCAFNNRFAQCKTEKQIIACTKNHKIRNGRKLNPKNTGPKLMNKAQAAYLKKMYAKLTRKELTCAFNKKYNTTLTLQQIVSFCKNHGIKSGRTGHFETGHQTWNAGSKGIMKGSSTSFKKGHAPKNARPIGHERICKKDGYIWIKVQEQNPHTGYNGHYVQKHRLIWKEAHGPIPKNKVLNFIDGNTLNCQLNNLELITRGELAQFNKNRLNSEKPELRQTARTTIKLIVKMNSLAKAA